jgi:hypothetical protein
MKAENAIVLRGTLPLVSTDMLEVAIKWIEDAEDEVIDVPEMRASADEKLALIKKARKALEDRREAEKAPHLQAGRDVDAQHNKVKDVLNSAHDLLQSKILAFDQARAKELADQHAASELAAKAVREKIAAEAKELEANGAPEAAAVMAHLSTMVVAAPVPIVAPKSEQSTTPVDAWHAELRGELIDLILAVATGTADPGYLMFNETFANAQARARKVEDLAPGVKGVKVTTLRGKGR